MQQNRSAASTRLPIAAAALVVACALVAYARLEARESPPLVAEAAWSEPAARLQARIESERLDTHLTIHAGDRIDEALARDLGEGVRLAQAACGESLCRFAFDFDDGTQVEASLAALRSALPWRSSVSIYTAAEDPRRVVLFTARGDQEPFAAN